MTWPTPKVLLESACALGEGPLWHTGEQRLYWVDIDRGVLHRCRADGSAAERFALGAAAGAFTIQRDGSLLLFMAEGAVRRWCEGALETVIDGIPEERGNRFNDVIADAGGRVFCGALSTARRAGRLYRLDPDGALQVLLEDVGTSNGLGFTPDGRGLYHTDTRTHTIYRFDYDADAGTIANRRPWVVVRDGVSRPDGLTVDAEGCVWSARWEGYAVVRYTPDGAEDRRVALPARKVTSLCFGGEQLDTLFITTASGDDPEQNGDAAGHVFHLRCGVRGVPEFRSALGLRQTVPPKKRK